ncbi:TPA: helix-turn-helix transcriptional regulator, partial [Mannheimia haemolytica]|nr:helix-turn-helix transcriptional regulator [Mannheimia haemolytica]
NSIIRKEWFTASEVAGMGNLPEQPSNVTRRATKNNWLKRQIEGKRGVAFEYHYSSLPISVQQELGFAQTAVKEEPRTLVAAQTADEMERVPFYNVQASAGFGAFNSEVYAPDDYIGLSKRWLDVRGFYLSYLAFITASGDSMYPTISDGDMLLVNRATTQPKDGKIYVFRQGEQLWVKRVQGIMGGIRLISDNKELYSPIDVIFDETLDFEVIGQVVYIGHEMI